MFSGDFPSSGFFLRPQAHKWRARNGGKFIKIFGKIPAGDSAPAANFEETAVSWKGGIAGPNGWSPEPHMLRASRTRID